MSTLQVQTLQGPTSGPDSNTVRVADNHKLHAKGHVVQFKEAVNTTEVNISVGVQATIVTLNFTPKFSDSLILCQAFHSQDGAVGGNSYCNAYIFAGTTEVGRAEAVGYHITRTSDARFTYGYSGSIASWGTTSLAIDLDVLAISDEWQVSRARMETSLLVWEIAQ